MRQIALLCAAVALTGCGNPDVTPATPSSKSASELKNAPTSLTVMATTLSATASAWVNMMPGTGPNQPLNILLKLQSSGGSVPDNVVPEKLYIIKGEQVWETGFSNEYRGPNAPAWEKIARVAYSSVGIQLNGQNLLNFAVEVRTPSGTQLVRVAGDQEVLFPQ